MENSAPAGPEEHPIIVGTAGHIDHGKTALIKALTGCDTDRLEEEKRRGITIELGFTSFRGTDGHIIGIVDTPGHEKFVKTMAAGAVGMDLALLVISAAEGIMPQTREHLSILELLQIPKLIVALTKTDLAGPEQVSLREQEIRSYLSKTAYAGAGIYPVSAKSGEGIAELSRAISEGGRELRGKSPEGVFRLPIDRVFSIPGQGTIVTGTLLSGRIRNQDSAMIYPEERLVRIRNVQVYGEDAERALAGERTALNLSGIEKQELRRGAVLAEPHSMCPSLLLDVRIRSLNDAGRSIRHNANLELLLGTAHIRAKLVLLKASLEEVQNGESELAQLQLEEPAAASRGDRFILRDESIRETLGGGCIIDPVPRGKHRRGRAAYLELLELERGSQDAVLREKLRRSRGGFVSFSALKREMQLRDSELFEMAEALRQKGELRILSSGPERYVFSEELLEKKLEELEKYLADFHKAYPYRAGEKQMVLRSRIFPELDTKLYLLLLDAWNEEKRIWKNKDRVSAAGYRVIKDARYTEISNRIINSLQKTGLSFIRIRDISFPKELEPWVNDVSDCLFDKKTIVKLDEEYCTLNSIYKKLLFLSEQELSESGKLTIDRLRDETGISRKNAKIFFRTLDRNHITRYNGIESERERF